MEVSNFPPGLALHELQCGMLVKLCDSAIVPDQVWMCVEPMANFSRSVKTLNRH